MPAEPNSVLSRLAWLAHVADLRFGPFPTYRLRSMSVRRDPHVFAWCEQSGRVRTIFLHLSSSRGRPYSMRFLRLVLAHELAHLRITRHGPRHAALSRAILRQWRKYERA
jgi:hypothetical protein